MLSEGGHAHRDQRDLWEVGVALNVHSGWPITGLSLGFDEAEDEYVPVPGPRNAAQLGTFASLDFRINREFPVRHGRLSGFFEVTNATNPSKEHLHDIWGPGWPEGLTLEQNLIDLGWHQKEFQRRRSFAYTVVALDESRVLGCVYIYPTRKTGYDAEVYLWARQSELASGMETELKASVKAWLAAKWPFKNAVLPGIDISMEEWEKQEDQKR